MNFHNNIKYLPNTLDTYFHQYLVLLYNFSIDWKRKIEILGSEMGYRKYCTYYLSTMLLFTMKILVKIAMMQKKIYFINVYIRFNFKSCPNYA